MEINPLDSRLLNFDMKIFQNIAKPSEAKKNINDNFYFLWNSFLQRLSKMITESLPQQSFFDIISIEKRRKRFGMKMKMKMNVEINSIVDFWYCSNFERSCHKTGMFVKECKWRKRRHGYMKKTKTWTHGKYIHSILFHFYFHFHFHRNIR